MAAQSKRRRIWRWAIGGLVVAGLVTLSLWPQPLRVEAAPATRGPLRVTIDGEGKTRVRERFDVLAPVSGRLERITLEAGDRVTAGAEIAFIEPLEPPLLDVRTRAEGESRVRAARAGVERSQASIEVARTAVELARRTFEREKALFEKGATPRARYESAELEYLARQRELDQARFAADAERHQLELAEAALGRVGGDERRSRRRDGIVAVRAPVSGSVLKVLRESAGVVTTGTPLVQLGDVSSLEIVVDLLSTDAVRVPAGARAEVVQWGGGEALMARVKRIEPAGFTKVSALGVEEQRVNVILGFEDAAAAGNPGSGNKAAGNPGAGNPSGNPAGVGGTGEQARLGDGYQAEVRIIAWEGEKVLQIPMSALFRHGQSWAVFVVEGKRAHRRLVEIGHRGDMQAEVTKGLREGEQVVLHPGDKLDEGTLVETG